jgi:ubiquitin-protein ligase
MNRSSLIRTQKDFRDIIYSLKKSDNLCFEQDPKCDLTEIADIANFTIILKGPVNSPYEDGKFKLKIKIPNDYPEEPPLIKMITKIYHPNIKDSGGCAKDETNICLDVLNTNWKPTYTLLKTFDFLYSLLKCPNNNDPLSGEVGAVFKQNHEKYLATAKEWTRKYAVV